MNENRTSEPSRETAHRIPQARPALDEARRCVSMREYAQAAGHFNRAVDEGSPFEGLCGLALCFYKMGRLSEALEAAAAAADSSPENALPHFLSGLVQKDAGRYDEASADFDMALNLGHPRAAVLYHRASAAFLAGRLAEAQSDFEETSRLEPSTPSAFYNLGVVCVHRSRWREAADAFSVCAKLDPAAAPYYHELLFALGKAQASEEFHFRGHRIKNMLALLADAVRRSHTRRGPAADTSHTSESIVERLEKILAEMSELLSFVKTDPLELDVWDIHDIIETALLSAGYALSDIHVVKEFGVAVPGLICDAPGLTEAFLNIILNAAEAMTSGGTLAIRTSWDSADTVTLEFEDTGGGIRVSPPEKAFHFAFTTKPNGTGLGLCQAERAVNEHGGTIRYRKAPHGALFIVELPINARAVESVQDIGLKPDLVEDVSILWTDEKEPPVKVEMGN